MILSSVDQEKLKVLSQLHRIIVDIYASVITLMQSIMMEYFFIFKVVVIDERNGFII